MTQAIHKFSGLCCRVQVFHPEDDLTRAWEAFFMTLCATNKVQQNSITKQWRVIGSTAGAPQDFPVSIGDRIIQFPNGDIIVLVPTDYEKDFEELDPREPFP